MKQLTSSFRAATFASKNDVKWCHRNFSVSVVQLFVSISIDYTLTVFRHKLYKDDGRVV